MASEFPFVEIAADLLPVTGEADRGTRIFRQAGTKEESGKWFDALCEHIGPLVSPGGVAMYAPVSRAGTYKRIREGRLTAFCFHELHSKVGLLGKKQVRSSPTIFIPVAEAKAWGEEMKAKRARGEKIHREETHGEQGDSNLEFLEWDSPWRKKKTKEERGKPLR